MTAKQDIDSINSWIAQNAQEFASVAPKTKAAAYYFTVLWSIFDLRHLERSASRDKLVAFCNRLPEELDLDPFEEHWDYFRSRLANDNGPTEHFEPLHGNDGVVAAILHDPIVAQHGTSKDRLTAMIFITYRLRCNLVHGNKYEDGLRDQYDNLMHGAKLTMLILEEAWRPKDTSGSHLTWDQE
ncbi:hypothetical protein [Sulfitobacter mediterraneus]|uniref:hypothetical protein n=1 Tax=Sulfitobacter mediterraneus TaxID=83219 RepID=UPI0021A8DB49|nr:hypothetical protein [Sulfitobacter mediterraneus]UWR10632.1 hypothetical protein K3753_15465 [Sulfitobacter mediterraneus]